MTSSEPIMVNLPKLPLKHFVEGVKEQRREKCSNKALGLKNFLFLESAAFEKYYSWPDF